jgi:hypothetical protein
MNRDLHHNTRHNRTETRKSRRRTVDTVEYSWLSALSQCKGIQYASSIWHLTSHLACAGGRLSLDIAAELRHHYRIAQNKPSMGILCSPGMRRTPAPMHPLHTEQQVLGAGHAASTFPACRILDIIHARGTCRKTQFCLFTLADRGILLIHVRRPRQGTGALASSFCTNMYLKLSVCSNAITRRGRKVRGRSRIGDTRGIPSKCPR